MRKFEQVCWFSFLALLFWLPIPLASNRVWSWSIIEVWVGLQTILLLIAYKGSMPWHRVCRFKWLLIPLSVFQVWVLLQTIVVPVEWIGWVSPQAEAVYQYLGYAEGALSLDRNATYVSFLKGISYLLFALNASILLCTVERIKTVLIVIIASATFQALYGSLSVLLGLVNSLFFSLEESDVATGTFIYKNHLANYLMMSLSLGVGLIVSGLHSSSSGSWHVRIKRWVNAALSTKMVVRLCLIIMVIALVMTRSRMGNTAFFAATIVGGLIALVFYKDRPRALTFLIVSILAIDTLVVGTVFGLGKVKERLVTTSVEAETRDQVVLWGLDILKDYPLTGTGAGSFYSIFPSYTQYNVGYYDHAHNDYLQFSIEVGLPATILLGAMVVYALWLGFSTIRMRNSKTLKGVGLGCVMAIVGMLIHITVDFNLQPPANALTFILVLILAVASNKIRHQASNEKVLNV